MRNDLSVISLGCSHFRLWDQSNCTVIIKLMGPFVRNIEKGDVIRVHRLLVSQNAFDRCLLILFSAKRSG